MIGDVIYNYRINRVGSITQKLVHPNEKRYLYEYMSKFKSAFEEVELIQGIKSNGRLSRVMWNELYASVTNNILDGEYKKARIRTKEKISKAILREYRPRSKKEKIMKFCLENSFVCLVLLVKLYYSNFEGFRKTKLLKKLSNS